VGVAFAQTGEGGGPPAIYNIGFLVILVAIFYFLLLRPEQRRRREHERLLAALKRNDQVVLSSGIHGRVAGIAEKTLAVEIAPKVQVQVERNAVQAVLRPPSAEGRGEREKEQKS
jgi:preprotein translocase subunit YajC